VGDSSSSSQLKSSASGCTAANAERYAIQRRDTESKHSTCLVISVVVLLPRLRSVETLEPVQNRQLDDPESVRPSATLAKAVDAQQNAASFVDCADRPTFSGVLPLEGFAVLALTAT
jgi:hypothetical protein